MMKWLGVALVLMSATPALAQEWWHGVWSYDLEWCEVADKIGSVTPAPIAITETEVLGYENSCQITYAQEIYGLAAVHLKLECQSEGSVFDEEQLIMRTDESGLAVWIWFGTGEPTLFQLCEEGAE